MEISQEALFLAIAVYIAGFLLIILNPVIQNVILTYFVMATFSLVIIEAIHEERARKVPMENIFKAMFWSFLNMSIIALFFSKLHTILLYIIQAPLVEPAEIIAFAFVVGFCETMFYIGLAFALRSLLVERYGKKVLGEFTFFAIAILFAFFFAIFHIRSYGFKLFFTLQPFIAGLINILIARYYRNYVGIALGHALTDAFLILSASLSAM